MRNTKKGFTLVELIVVITILAVLATIAFLTLGDYPAQSRDTKRQASVANILEKIKVESATGYKSFIEWVNGDPTTTATAGSDGVPTGVTIENLKIANWKVNFTELRESADSFKVTRNNKDNPYDLFSATWTEKKGTEQTRKYCHEVRILGGTKGYETRDPIKKWDCPKFVPVTEMPAQP